MTEEVLPSIMVKQNCHHTRNGENKKAQPNPLFHDPVQLITDLAFLIFTLILIPIRNTLHYLFSKPKSLKGKICLVTGSGRGLGREICIALAEEGAILACCDINEENNNNTVEILTKINASVKGYKLNVANKQEAEEVVRQVERDLGPIYLLVNNAGIILPSSEPTEEYIRAVFNVNILGAIWMTSAVLPLMKNRNKGHIVNISSISGLYGTPVLSAYGASKAALSNYSQSLRLELSFNPHNRIHVTCVHPDVINTSTDYVEMLTKRLAARDVHKVVADIMEAIKYNKTDVSSPSFYYYLCALNVLFPNEVVHKFIKLMDLTFTVPTVHEWNQLPVADIVRSCNTPPPCSTPEQEKLCASLSPENTSSRKARKISFTTIAASEGAHELRRSSRDSQRSEPSSRERFPKGDIQESRPFTPEIVVSPVQDINRDFVEYITSLHHEANEIEEKTEDSLKMSQDSLKMSKETVEFQAPMVNGNSETVT